MSEMCQLSFKHAQVLNSLTLELNEFQHYRFDQNCKILFENCTLKSVLNVNKILDKAVMIK